MLKSQAKPGSQLSIWFLLCGYGNEKRFSTGHTSPSLVQTNNSVDAPCSERKEDSSNRLSLPNAGELGGNISHSVTLAQASKNYPRKRSRFKVLLSPRNPYEEFHKLFSDIPKDEFPINDYSCALSRDILVHGRLFLSQNWLCFYSNIFGFETIVKLELQKVKSVARAKTAYMFPNAILVRTEKKKYLFCSFLMRDGAHKLLSTIWQESNNNKPDSGVDETSGNGDQDEDDQEESENLEDDADCDESERAVSSQELTSPKDPAFWKLAKHHRTVSCPNTPLSRHTSVEEQSEVSTSRNHQTDHQNQRRSWFSTSIKYISREISRVFCNVLKNLYYWLSSLVWLFKRNKFNSENFLLLSSFFLIVLLITTFVLMDRIAKLEDRFHRTLPGQNLITAKQSDGLGNDETGFCQKTERFNQALKGLILSVENVQSKLKSIKDELGEPTDVC